MIGVQRLSRILRVLATSDQVAPANARLSAILIAPSDAGKSELLLSHLPPAARILDDFTASSLYHLLKDKDRPDWIVVPDLNALISHKPSVANLTMANLLSLLGEGTTEILGPDGAKLKVDDGKSGGIRLGLLTGVTPDMFFSKRGRWRATGFLRRLVPIYYTYGAETQLEIQDAIRTGTDTTAYTRVSMPMRLGKPASIAIPDPIARDAVKLSEDAIRYQLRWRAGHGTGSDERSIRAFELPFSLHKIYRRYLRSHARLQGRTRVAGADLIALQDFHKFVRYDQPEIL